ncbi:putative Transmembrane protein [Quillaja saponaria]|uniref:Transmembrane protein n=1 Tax=Quillaja saponaria TaxID=32244 RepID=A0AAD7PQJ5_QUISA|nr:putative Transmembrane protein [Quillaja saponaria]
MRQQQDMKMSLTLLAPRLSTKPAMIPASANSQQQDELQFSDDKHYAKHGEIMLLVLVIAFSLFIFLIVTIPCLRRGRDLESGGYGDTSSDMKSPSRLSAAPRIDVATGEVSLEGKTEVSRKYPL